MGCNLNLRPSFVYILPFRDFLNLESLISPSEGTRRPSGDRIVNETILPDLNNSPNNQSLYVSE